jgi:sporulation protein YlmC with PRC-barrel domain
MKTLLALALATALVGLPLGAGLAQQAPPPSNGGSAGLTITSDSLLGTKVRNAEGKEIGQVSKLLIDPKDGRITSVLITRGGVLGIGGKEVSVPWDALKVQRDQQQVVITMQQEMLEQAPSASPPSGPEPAQKPPRQQ